MKIAITGHRSEDCESEESVRRVFREAFKATPGIEAVIVGMANGVDLWVGDEALDLGLPVWAVRPWRTHRPRASDVELYARIVGKASELHVVTLSDKYDGPWVYHKRNAFMVDHADEVFAYLNPASKSGGTYSCVQYALKKEKKVLNLYGKA